MNKKLLFQKAKEAGFSACELYEVQDSSTKISTCDGNIDKLQISSSRTVCFRGIIEGKSGNASTQKVDDSSIEWLINTAKESALLVEKDDKEFIYDKKDEYAQLDCYDPELIDFDTQKQMDITLEIDKKVLELGKLLKKTETTVLVDTNNYNISNSYGLDISQQSTVFMAYTMPIAPDGEGIVNGFEMDKSSHFNNVNINKLAQKAVDATMQKIGATSLPSGKYKIIFENDMTSSLLNIIKNSFFADIMQEGKSKYKDCIGQLIASENINIVDNPLLENSTTSRIFDDEGVATYKKYVVENGVFKGFLYNLKTAHKDGVQTTGNASKASITAPIKVNSQNLCIEAGEMSIEELIQHAKDGIYITDLAGLHSGANTITGDFSLLARGVLIENGKLTKPVKEITIAGNVFEVIKNVEGVANDFKTYMMTSAPSILVSELSVAGK